MEDGGVPHKKNSFPSTILTQWISCTQCHKIFQKVKWFFPVQAVATIVSRDLDLRIEKKQGICTIYSNSTKYYWFNRNYTLHLGIYARS